MTDILHHSGTEPEERKLIEIEQEAWRTINAQFADKEEKFIKELEEKDKALEEKDKVLEKQLLLYKILGKERRRKKKRL